MNHPSQGICMYLCAVQHNTVSPYWVQSQSEENEPCQCSVRGHNAVTKGLRLRPTGGKCRGGHADTLSVGVPREQTCRTMLGHSTPSLGGSTCSKGNFVEPVLFQLERWDFTLHQSHDRDAPSLWRCAWLRVWVCGKRQRKVKEKEQQGHKTPHLPDTSGKNACLSTWRHEQNSFTVTLAATTGR